jgi:hypothetical protein
MHKAIEPYHRYIAWNGDSQGVEPVADSLGHMIAPSHDCGHALRPVNEQLNVAKVKTVAISPSLGPLMNGHTQLGRRVSKCLHSKKSGLRAGWRQLQ